MGLLDCPDKKQFTWCGIRSCVDIGGQKEDWESEKEYVETIEEHDDGYVQNVE